MGKAAAWPTRWTGWWVASDGKALLIETRAGRVLVSVAPHRQAIAYETAELLDGRTRRVEQLEATPLVDNEGCTCLQVEAGTPGVGPTYRLCSMTESSLGALAPARDGLTAAEVVLLPSTSIGLHDDWEDDLGVPWAVPLLPLRWAGSA